MNVEIIHDGRLWDAFVSTLPEASFYHHWVWGEIIEEAFGHRRSYLAATRGGSICGVLPLFSIRSRFFGHSLVSLPFFSYGGLLASDAEARVALLESAAALARENRARRIELRQGDPCPMGWESVVSKVTMEIPLPGTSAAYWASLSSGIRNKLRNAQRQGFRLEWGGIEALPVFYRLFALSMHNHGTPVYPSRFFEAQLRHLPGFTRILSLWDGDKAVAAAFVTAHPGALEIPWSASLPESRKRYAPLLMFFTVIEKAIEEGRAAVDLGRSSPGSGTHEFKRHLNAVERPLHWYYWLAPGASLPHLHADNAKFRLAIELWKRLPLAVANSLGPRVVRSLP